MVQFLYHRVEQKWSSRHQKTNVSYNARLKARHHRSSTAMDSEHLAKLEREFRLAHPLCQLEPDDACRDCHQIISDGVANICIIMNAAIADVQRPSGKQRHGRKAYEAGMRRAVDAMLERLARKVKAGRPKGSKGRELM